MPDKAPEVAHYRELSNPGDDSGTRYFTIPPKFRVSETSSPEADNSGVVPESASLERGEKFHFVSATSLVRDNPKAIYLFTVADLEQLVGDANPWADNVKSIARLLNSEASHLISETDVATETPQMSVQTDDESVSLREQLNITQGSVPDEFTVQQATIDITDVSREIYSNTNLKYLLVRYGISEHTKQNQAEDPEVLKILNKIVDVETSYRPAEQTIEATVPFCTHERHAAEFKFFVDVLDPDMIETVERIFANSQSCDSASISDSLEDRVYMIHKNFPTNETASGFINNVLYPK